MKLAKDLLICMVLIALAAFLVRGAMLFQSAQSLTDAARKSAEGLDLMRITIQSQLAGKYGLINELTAVARESRKTIDVLQKTSLAERMKVAAFSDASIRAVNDLDTVERNAALAVQALQGMAEQLGAASAALRVDVESARPTIDSATTLLATLNSGSGQALDRASVALGDLDERVKALEPIQRNLDITSAKVAHGTGELDDIATDGAEYIHKLTHPQEAGFWRAWATALLGPGARVILDHLWPVRVKVVH